MTALVISERESVTTMMSLPERKFEVGSVSRTAPATTSAKVYRIERTQYDHVDEEPGAISIAQVVREFESAGLSSNLKRARKRLRANMLPVDDKGLKALRLANGFSQMDVAREINSTQAHIARLESGCIDPTLSMCNRLAGLFGVDCNRIAEAFEFARSARG